MAFERAEFDQKIRGVREQRSQEQTAFRLRLAERGAVAAEKLTGDPNWDAFASILQGQIDAARTSRGQILERLGSGYVDAAERERLAQEAVRLHTIATTLDLVLTVPKVLREDGERAREAFRPLG